MVGEAVDHPVGLVLLAHHGGGDLWFTNRNDAWSWTELPDPNDPFALLRDLEVPRRFGEGSAAVLVACSPGDLKDPLSLITRLNENGIDTMIFSPFNIVADFGLRLAQQFALV